MFRVCEQAVGNLSMGSGLTWPILGRTYFCTQAAIYIRRFSTAVCAQFYTAKGAILPLFEQWLYPSSTGLITIIIIK